MAEQTYRIVWDRRTTFELNVTVAELAKLLRVDEYKIAERIRESGINTSSDLRPALDPMGVLTGALRAVEHHARGTDSAYENVEILTA